MSLYDEQRHKFRLVCLSRTEFGEMHVFGQKLVFEFRKIVDLGYRDDGEFPEVGIDDDRLRIGVTDDSYSCVAFEFVQLVFELASEIGTFDVVDRAFEAGQLCTR